MSRIGKQPVEIPAGVDVAVNGQTVDVRGPRGELSLALHPHVRVSVRDQAIRVEVLNPEEDSQRALWGLTRNLLRNMVVGVTAGFVKQLEFVGVGYRVAVVGPKVTLSVGFSHPVEIALPAGIEGSVEKNILTLSGIDKQVVGEVAASIRRIRKPEPYKGKGIRYVGEIIRRKAGKAAKAAA